MGIPKFYRWLSERYPLLNQKLTVTEGPPEIDNLYLDMNGIIHNCTHANRKDIGDVTEEDMMLKVFDYLEKLVQIVRPQKLLFMAIDGVAPRAKMNQQRSRRFKSAMERLKNEEEQRRKGEAVPADPFDSNCITPGTEFMARLGKHLRFFIRRKMSEDPLWQKPTVVFSGHEVPGEGEHKIMEYIRWEKRQPNFQPNQRHCMYGLDADLIMLSLVSHEPHFCLLREVVSYTGNNRGQPAREVLENPCAENFILFQIGLLREYFELEFGNIRLPFKLDLERIVDDYVLLCMLVGNDFLPALPTLDIAEGALNKLMDLYKELLPTLGGYLTFAGDLDRRRLEAFLDRIGQLELQTLEERAKDAEYFESKRAKRAARAGGQRSQLDEIDAGMHSLAVSQPNGARRDPTNDALEPEAVAGPGPGTQGPTMMSREARQLVMAGLGDEGLQMWKDRYYNEKLHADQPEDRRLVVEHYVAGLHWVLEYYYRGVASWDWYYPYHYAPMASDLVNLDAVQVAFAQGSPFRPFEQLLAVLPAASSKLLPSPFRVLMMDPESPIIDFYPTSFQVDMEGKRADWEGVVLVPFVDEVRLLAASRSIKSVMLSAEELARNAAGQIQVFKFSRNTSEAAYCTSTMPKHFRDLKVCHSRCQERPPPPPLPACEKGFVPALVPGTRVGLETLLGMPTLKSLQVRPSLRNVGVNVLGTPSRKESLVLGLLDLREALNGAVLSAEQVATSGLLGSRVYINWPYLQEARVVRVSDRSSQVSYDSKGAVKVQCWQMQETQRWDKDAAHLASTFLMRCGMDVGKVDLVIGVKVCLGYIRHGDGTIEKTYSKDEVQVPLQAVIRQRPQQYGHGQTVADDVPGYPTLYDGMQVVFLGKHHYGCMATVRPDLGKGLSKQGKPPSKLGAAAANGHYRVLVQPATNQAGVEALRSAKRVVERFAVKYYTSGEVSSRVGITPRLLGRITGNMWTRDGDDRYDIGLAIKTPSKDVCVPGFSQPTLDGNGWSYSAAVVNIIQEYRSKFPWLWVTLLKSEGESAGDLRLDQMLPGLTPADRKEKVREVIDWIKSTPLAKRPLVKVGTQVLSDEGVKALQAIVTPCPERPPPPAEYENVPPLLLLPPYTPGADQVKLVVQGGSFYLGDRVVCVSGKGTPPYGLRGTVIGVYEEACEVLFDEEFGGGSNLNGRVNGKCGAYVPLDLLLCVNKPVEMHLAKHQMPRHNASKQAASATAVGGSDKAAGDRIGQGATTPKLALDAAARAVQRAIQQPVVSGTGASPCVPASVAVPVPGPPPIPSSTLLGAAMRNTNAAKPSAQQQPQDETSTRSDGGKVLLQMLTAGSQSRCQTATSESQVEAAPRAAGASAPAIAPVPAGWFAQLQMLVPNARVGLPASVSQGVQPSAQPLLPVSQDTTSHKATEKQQMQAPFTPMPYLQMPLQGGAVPMPQPSAAIQPRAPYITGSSLPHQQPTFFPPHVPNLLVGGMPVAGPFSPGVMMPPPAGPMVGTIGDGHFLPYAVPPPPPQASLQPLGPAQPAYPSEQRHQPAMQIPCNGGGRQAQAPLPQGRGKSVSDAANLAEGAASAAQLRSKEVASGAANGTGTMAVPAPKSHPIDVDPMQSIDDAEEAAPGSTRSLTEGRSAAAGSAHGRSARLPDAFGRGFRGRGRPVLASGLPEPSAPGSQSVVPSAQASMAPAQLPSARHSLDCAQAGQTLLRSLHASAAKDNCNSGISASMVTSPTSISGEALLRKLQKGSASADADTVTKVQSVDSGAELLRALQRELSLKAERSG
ncbi:hypothetical protein Vretimale_14135 [Volvox reticuliferus]|uniref:Uncharacterized protein n=1 Tax=Volvox reticuliferus TaxID=1737510 RepID=A0A8J4LUY0_9CHLO|nr:hypothetical protein Vretifemale_16195 [Volvox reticuliferus]GIM10403.1 hypothetical protein Vretimale_14135 [Volvox reticuliferus]